MMRFSAVVRYCLFAGTLALGMGFAVAQDPTPVITVPNPPNTTVQQKKHYVILISLDGLRYDYPRRYGAPHLLKLGAHGASAPDGMLPEYPSLTFPNHLSIVTGLYPEHHGIVGNSFWDPARDQTYVYTQCTCQFTVGWILEQCLWWYDDNRGIISCDTKLLQQRLQAIIV